MSRRELEELGVLTAGVSLAASTTYKLGGAAAWLAEPSSLSELQAVVEAFAGTDVLMLGRGSNLVVADKGFDGLVVRLGSGFAEIEVADDRVRAGGAVSLPVLARTAVQQGRGGLEWCVGVPGSVGGAVRMNAGCHGSDVADCLDTASVIDLRDGSIRSLTAEDMELAYRSSNLAQPDAVVEATFLTSEIDPDDGAREIRRITQWRREHQPGGTLNAGSVFKNPSGDVAGRIIDDAGLKGLARGGVRVSEKHANFLEADPGASAQDVYDLVWAVRKLIGDTTGVWLEPEVRFAGEFEPSPDEAP
ncbi:MAG: UDP-N-acetylmuramate dehydrogenase [Acidimicrobiia bacterium]